MLSFCARSREWECLPPHASVLAFVAMTVLSVSADDAHADLLGDTLKPFASVAEIYDSNVFRMRDREQLRALIGKDRLGDSVTVASVGTGIDYGLSRQELHLLLKRDFIRFGHYSDQDSDRDEASGNVILRILNSATLKADGAYMKFPQPRADFRSPGTNTVTSVTGGGTAGYETASGVGADFSYHRVSLKYSLPQLRSSERTADRYAGSLAYRLSPKTKVYGTCQREETTYRDKLQVGAVTVDNSSVADTLLAGFERNVSQKTLLSGYVGVLDLRHQASSARDFTGVVGKASASYGVTGKMAILLSWERQLYEETYVGRIYSVNNSLAAGVNYEISPRMRATVLETSSWRDYQDVANSGLIPRSDFTQELNVGVEWMPIRRLTASIGYVYSDRSSDDSTFDYTAHTVTAAVSYRY